MFSYTRINIGIAVASIFLGAVFAFLRIFSILTDFTAFIGALLVFAFTGFISITLTIAKYFSSGNSRLNLYDRERKHTGKYIFLKNLAVLLGVALAAVFSSAVFLLVRGNTLTEGMFIFFSISADIYLLMGLFLCFRQILNTCETIDDRSGTFADKQIEASEKHNLRRADGILENRYQNRQESYRDNEREDYRNDIQESYRNNARIDYRNDIQESYRDNERVDYRNDIQESYGDNRRDYRNDRQENYLGNRNENYCSSRRRKNNSRN